MATFTQNRQTTLAGFIDEYVNRGFGSMNKNDFEVWIFDYLLQGRLTGMSNYEISVELRIPESKVKRLRYEASLKYGNPADTDQYSKAFQNLLEKVNLKRGSNSIIQFAVEDIQLRKFLDSILKRNGRFADTSFNSEVVSVTLDDLAILIEETCTEQEKAKLLKKAKGNDGAIGVIRKGLGSIINAALDNGATTLINIGINAIMNII